jgi:hypothetical protein
MIKAGHGFWAYFDDGRVTPVEAWCGEGITRKHDPEFPTDRDGAAPLVLDPRVHGLMDARNMPGFVRVESSQDYHWLPERSRTPRGLRRSRRA